MAITLTPRAGSTSGEYAISSSTKVMVNADTVFNIENGPIQILSLLSVCVTTNDTTATTMQWQHVPTVGSAATISGASTTLASIAAGGTVRLAPTALSTALAIALASAAGAQLGTNVGNRIIVTRGALKLVIGVGSTTGTWKHYLHYAPLGENVYVTAV